MPQSYVGLPVHLVFRKVALVVFIVLGITARIEQAGVIAGFAAIP